MKLHESAERLMSEARTVEEKEMFEKFLSMVFCYRKYVRLQKLSNNK